jgi:hypothetical protein
MRHLAEFGTITVDTYTTLAGLSRATASATLITLTLANVLKIIPDETVDSFEAI